MDTDGTLEKLKNTKAHLEKAFGLSWWAHEGLCELESMLEDGSDNSEVDWVFAEILKSAGEAAKCSRALEIAVDEIVTRRGRDLSTVQSPEEIEPEQILKESNNVIPDNTIAEYLCYRTGEAMEIEHMFEDAPPSEDKLDEALANMRAWVGRLSRYTATFESSFKEFAASRNA